MNCTAFEFEDSEYQIIRHHKTDWRKLYAPTDFGNLDPSHFADFLFLDDKNDYHFALGDRAASNKYLEIAYSLYSRVCLASGF